MRVLIVALALLGCAPQVQYLYVQADSGPPADAGADPPDSPTAQQDDAAPVLPDAWVGPDAWGDCAGVDCPTGRVCVDGQCRASCASPSDCVTIDSTLRYCQPVTGVGRVCGDCMTGADCRADQVCWHWSCR